MGDNEPKEKWRIETNDRYQRVIGIIISLASGVLFLPLLLLKDILPIPKTGAAFDHLTLSVIMGWSLLGLSILSGVIFNYLSVKWVKQAWGQEIWFTSSRLEKLLDWTFWITAACYILGLIMIIYFASTFTPTVRQ